MPSAKLLEFNQYEKSDKVQLIIYADLKYIIEKIDGCKNNPKRTYSIRLFNVYNIYIYTYTFRSIENKHNVHRGKDCMIKFCESLREHAMKLINLKRKK